MEFSTLASLPWCIFNPVPCELDRINGIVMHAPGGESSNDACKHDWNNNLIVAGHLKEEKYSCQRRMS